VIISSVGSEIYYGAKRKPGIGWETHISCQWNREKIYDVLKELDFLTYQEDESQRPFKVSYYLEPNPDHLAKVQELLVRNKCKHNLIYSHDRFLDILPYRASKGKAIRYLSYQLNVSLNHFFVCGDSGNDEEMLRGEPRAIVVGNYSSELEPLKESRHVYFADRPCAGGIIEGLNHYNFIES